MSWGRIRRRLGDGRRSKSDLSCFDWLCARGELMLTFGGRKKERVGRWEEVDRARKEEREERVRQIRERYVLFLFTLIRFRRDSD